MVDATVCREFLTLLNSQNVARLDISPGDQGISFPFARNHQVFNLLIVDLVGDLPLSELKSEISHAH